MFSFDLKSLAITIEIQLTQLRKEHKKIYNQARILLTLSIQTICFFLLKKKILYNFTI